MPNDVNKTKIFKLMDETIINRQLWIKSENNSELTLHTILKTFPRFLDFNGELVSFEYFDCFINSKHIIDKNIDIFRF